MATNKIVAIDDDVVTLDKYVEAYHNAIDLESMRNDWKAKSKVSKKRAGVIYHLLVDRAQIDYYSAQTHIFCDDHISAKSIKSRYDAVAKYITDGSGTVGDVRKLIAGIRECYVRGNNLIGMLRSEVDKAMERAGQSLAGDGIVLQRSALVAAANNFHANSWRETDLDSERGDLLPSTRDLYTTWHIKKDKIMQAINELVALRKDEKATTDQKKLLQTLHDRLENLLNGVIADSIGDGDAHSLMGSELGGDDDYSSDESDSDGDEEKGWSKWK